jgi:hypothetical protein
MDHFHIYLIGYLFNYLIILLILGPIFLATGSHFVKLLINYNLLLMICAILPIPKNDGLILFFAHRETYIAVVSFVIVMSLLIYVGFLGGIFTLFLALILWLIVARIIMLKFKV